MPAATQPGAFCLDAAQGPGSPPPSEQHRHAPVSVVEPTGWKPASTAPLTASLIAVSARATVSLFWYPSAAAELSFSTAAQSMLATAVRSLTAWPAWPCSGRRAGQRCQRACHRHGLLGAVCYSFSAPGGLPAARCNCRLPALARALGAAALLAEACLELGLHQIKLRGSLRRPASDRGE